MPNTKEQIRVALDRLPEEKHEEVLDFIEFLEHRIDASDDEASENGREELDPSENPLRDFIGSVSHGSLAQNIDEDLYGR
jgi:hypothetical protein